MISTKNFLFAKISLGLFIFLSLFTPSFTTAQITQSAEDIVIYPPETRINIPGVEFSEINSIRERAKARAEREQRIVLEIPFLAEYISGIFNYALSAGALLAVIMIIVGGFQWAMSAGNSDAVSQAKSRITKAITGLIILLLSYSLLYAINPSLTRFKAISLVYVQPIDSDFDTQLFGHGEEDFNDINSFGFGTPSDITEITNSIQGLKSQNKKTHFIRSVVIPDLKKAIGQHVVETGNFVRLNSAFRTARKQYSLMQEKCGCFPENELPSNIEASASAWKPYCTRLSANKTCNSVAFVKRENGQFVQRKLSHMAGHALDISDEKSGSYQLCANLSDPKEIVSSGVISATDEKKSLKNNYCIPKNQQILIDKMISNNFCVGLAGQNTREPWHFEYSKSGDKLSPFTTCDRNNEYLKKLCYLKGNTNPECN